MLDKHPSTTTEPDDEDDLRDLEDELQLLHGLVTALRVVRLTNEAQAPCLHGETQHALLSLVDAVHRQMEVTYAKAQDERSNAAKYGVDDFGRPFTKPGPKDEADAA